MLEMATIGADYVEPLREAIGLMAWNPSIDDSGYLRIEFGLPYLVVREPIVDPATGKAGKIFSRLRVLPKGQISLWVQCDKHFEDVRQSPSRYEVDEKTCLEVEGEILSSVEQYYEGDRNLLRLKFSSNSDLIIHWSQSGEDDEAYSCWNINGLRTAVLLSGNVEKKPSLRNVYNGEVPNRLSRSQ